MSSAKGVQEATQNHLSQGGKRDTTVRENIAPAVTRENVNPSHHEDVQRVVDKEVHQDHHHTSVQPVQHREVLPETHHYKTRGIENREFKHGDSTAVKDKVAAEANQFRNERSVAGTTETRTAKPEVAGEHVHHHVHETIQPVVHKETIQPSVTHTTVPVHEVHQNTPQHHGSSVLPAMTSGEFAAKDGTTGGREDRTDFFEGEPHNQDTTGFTPGTTTSTNGLHSHGGKVSSNSRAAANDSAQPHRSTATSDTTNAGRAGEESVGKDPASLKNKLNPFKDADGDGKKGIFS